MQSIEYRYDIKYRNKDRTDGAASQALANAPPYEGDQKTEYQGPVWSTLPIGHGLAGSSAHRRLLGYQILISIMDILEIAKPLEFTYINDDITDEKFPDDGQRGTDPKIYKFGRGISSESVVAEMEKEGYRPMTIHELVLWAKDNWNKNDYVVALGTVRQVGDCRRVACLYGGSFRRYLRLRGWGGGWDGDYSFAAVRKLPLVAGMLDAGSGPLVAGQFLKKGQEVEVRDGKVFARPKVCKTCKRPFLQP